MSREPQTLKATSTYVSKTQAHILGAKYKDIIPSDAPELAGVEGIPATPRCEHCNKAMPFSGYLRNNFIFWVTSIREACTCPQAKAEMERLEAEWAEQERQAQERRKQKRIAALVEASGLTARNRVQTFEKWEPRDEKMRGIKQFLEGYADAAMRGDLDQNDGRNSLFLHGSCGAGKTHLACAVANALLDAGKPVLMTTFGDLMQDIKSTWVKGTTMTEKDIINEYRNAPMLIIDDLGKEKPTEWSASTLFAVLNHRYSEMKPTIITSNFAPAETIGRIAPSEDDALCGRSIISRINEVYSVIHIYADDHRNAKN